MKPVVKKFLRYGFGVVIVLTLFYVLFLEVGLVEIYQVLVRLNPVWLLPFLLLYSIVRLISVINIDVVLQAMHKKVKFYNLFKYVSLTISVGKFIPGKLGDLSIFWLLKEREKISYGETLTLQVLDKIVTLVVTGVIAIYGLIYIFGFPFQYILMVVLVLVGLLLALIVLWSDKFRELFKKYVLKKNAKYFKNFSASLKYVVKKRKTYLILNVILTTVLLFANYTSGYFVFLAFGEHISVMSIASIMAILVVLNFIPLPFSGIGVREISGIYLFSLLGVSAAVATNYMLFILVVKYFNAVFFYLLYRKEF